MQFKGDPDKVHDEDGNEDDDEPEHPIPSVQETAIKLWDSLATLEINVAKKAELEAAKAAREPGAQWKGDKVRFELPEALKVSLADNEYVDDWAPTCQPQLRAGFIEGPYSRTIAMELVMLSNQTMSEISDPKLLAAWSLLKIINETLPCCE